MSRAMRRKARRRRRRRRRSRRRRRRKVKRDDEMASKARMTMSTTEQGADDFLFECEPSGLPSRQCAAASSHLERGHS